jgi:hypothetical protein
LRKAGLKERKLNAETQRARRIRGEEHPMVKRKTTKISPKLTGKKKKVSVEELQKIAKKFRKHLRGPLIDHGELLYDENGLPK